MTGQNDIFETYSYKIWTVMLMSKLTYYWYFLQMLKDSFCFQQFFNHKFQR